MLRFAALILLISSILCQEFLYLSNEKSVALNNVKCVNSVWTRVDYKSIGITAPNSSWSGLRANGKSCASVPVLLQAESSLNVIVYVDAVNINSGIIISVAWAEGGLITRALYNRESVNFEEGWKEISLNIDESGPGYINLLGYNRDSENVLVDSVRYTYNYTSIDTNTDNRFIVDEKYEEINIKQYIENHLNENDIIDVNEEADEYLRHRDVYFRDTDSDSLGLWTIVLICVGCVTVVALLMVGAYFIGKHSAKSKEDPVIPIYDIEPPKVDILPRVRGTVEPYQLNYES